MKVPIFDLTTAIKIAQKAHAEQVDKSGTPYIVHLISVMNRCRTEDEKIVAILHDLLEDTPWTAQDLRHENCPERIIEAIIALSKIEGESYQNFIQRVANNPIAQKVKLADLEDNLDVRRLGKLNEKDFQRINKYLKAYHYLINHV